MPGEVGPPSGCRRSEDVRTPAGPVVACPPRPVPPWDVRPTGRADVQRPRVQHPRVRCLGVRGIQVSGRTGSGVRGAAAGLSAPRWAWSGSVWWAAPLGAAGSICPPWSAGGVVACRIGPGQEGMVRRSPWLARTRVARSQGRRLAGGLAAAPSWPQRADMGAGPGPGCRPGGREHGTEPVLTGPRRASWAGRRRGASHGPGPGGGGDHAGWSLGEGGPVASSSGGPTRFGGGAACGRGA
jgi:hypothetical protein